MRLTGVKRRVDEQFDNTSASVLWLRNTLACQNTVLQKLEGTVANPIDPVARQESRQAMQGVRSLEQGVSAGVGKAPTAPIRGRLEFRQPPEISSDDARQHRWDLAVSGRKLAKVESEAEKAFYAAEQRSQPVEAASAAEARSQATEFKSSLLQVEESARRQFEEIARKLPVANEPMAVEDSALANIVTQLEQELADTIKPLGARSAELA